MVREGRKGGGGGGWSFISTSPNAVASKSLSRIKDTPI